MIGLQYEVWPNPGAEVQANQYNETGKPHTLKRKKEKNHVPSF